MMVRWLSYDARIDGPQIVASLAHALRQKAIAVPYPTRAHRATQRALKMAIDDRYYLCHDLGLGQEADTLVFEHRFEVAR